MLSSSTRKHFGININVSLQLKQSFKLRTVEYFPVNIQGSLGRGKKLLLSFNKIRPFGYVALETLAYD